MTNTKTLTDHEDIRAWAAARAGAPAINWANATVGGGGEPTLLLVFDQRSYEDQDQGYDRPMSAGDIELVEWDEWFEHFDRLGLALVVAEDTPNQRDEFHEIIARPE